MALTSTQRLSINAIGDSVQFFENCFSSLAFSVGNWDKQREWWDGWIPLLSMAIKARTQKNTCNLDGPSIHVLRGTWANWMHFIELLDIYVMFLPKWLKMSAQLLYGSASWIINSHIRRHIDSNYYCLTNGHISPCIQFYKKQNKTKINKKNHKNEKNIR